MKPSSAPSLLVVFLSTAFSVCALSSPVTDRTARLDSIAGAIAAGESNTRLELDRGVLQELFTLPAGARTASATSSLLLSKQSVSVTVTWKNYYVDPPTTGTASALQQDDTYGFLYFFGESNPEVLVKVLDGFGDGKYRVFYAGLTTLEFTVTVNVLCGNQVNQTKSFVKPFDPTSTSTNTGGTDGTLNVACQTTPLALSAGVASVNTATGALTIVGGGATTVGTVGTTITVTSPATPAGTTGQTLRFNGTALASSSALTNDGTNVGISGALAVSNPFTMTTAGLPLLRTNDTNVQLGKEAGAIGTGAVNNTAIGSSALRAVSTGGFNTAVGKDALKLLTTISQNTAIGTHSLAKLTAGGYNASLGDSALANVTNSLGSAAFGSFSLGDVTSGSYNTGFGVNTLTFLTTGDTNTAVGAFAGQNLLTGSANVYIRSFGPAAAGGSESNTTRIGQEQTRTFITGIRGVTTGVAGAIAVLIDTNGQLGTASSSRRVKDDIFDMGGASERILQLRPVTFRYKAHAGQESATQFGLIAEEVDEVVPELVARSADGEVETVMYNQLPAMLLNELQKAVRKIEAADRRIEALERELGELKRLRD